jgi:hypothetical protein
MLQKENTTVVGTMRLNRRDIPKKAKDVSGRLKKSKAYFKSGNQIMVSYWDKGTKPVIVLSTMHTSALNMDDGLPEIISFYNKTKSGVDSMDHMLRMYTTKRKCFRWTFAFFCNLIDIALLNASIIMRIVNPSLTPGKENSFRYNFLLEVGYQLLDAHIKKRIQQRVSKQAYTAMEFLGYKRDFKPQIETYGERRLMGRCTTCSRKNDKKTTQKCSSCHSFVCNEHATKFVKCNTCEH